VQEQTRTFARQAGVDALEALARATAATRQPSLPALGTGRHRQERFPRRFARLAWYAVAVGVLLGALMALAWYALVSAAMNSPQLARS
jgi:hypothetical protein